MMKTNNSRKGLFGALVAMAIVCAICLSCIALAATGTIEQTIHVKQTIVKESDDKKVSYDEPTVSEYTYQLVPKIADAPMPEGTTNGVYQFKLKGDAETSFKVTFPLDATHDFQYELRRVEKTPDGETVNPETHVFGYQVVNDDQNGGFKIIPYTCYDSEYKIWDEHDANGNPIGITLYNKVMGIKKEEPTTKQDEPTTKKDEPTTKSNQTTKTYNTTKTPATRTNVVTQTIRRAVNTGDPYSIGLWVGILALAGISLVIVGIVRRKKENDDDEEII